jgi:hypothetical protein
MTAIILITSALLISILFYFFIFDFFFCEKRMTLKEKIKEFTVNPATPPFIVAFSLIFGIIIMCFIS